MSTTPEMIRGWFMAGRQMGATHMIVACDTFDWDDYPVYVMPGQDVREISQKYDVGHYPMQKIMEVYALHLDLDAQLAEVRALHFDPPPAVA